jgi:GDPmannose 4,6-dehydratase
MNLKMGGVVPGSAERARSATGEQHSVRDFVELAAKEIDIRVRREGKGENEKDYDANTGKWIVAFAPKYYRLTEVETLLGDRARPSRNSVVYPPPRSRNSFLR